MKIGRRIRQGGLIAFAFLAGAGCSLNTAFVYKPGPALQGAAGLPAKVAVLPFQDGTENFTRSGSYLNPETLNYNLAKGGISGTIDAVTPELWAKSFAEELAASGAIRSARFVYSPSELRDEDFYVEGTVLKMNFSGAWVVPNEYVVAFRAFRRADKSPVWEKKVTRSWKNTPAMYKGCGLGGQCMADANHADVNRVMQGMFSEAREDFVATLAAQSGGGSASGKPPSAAEKPATAPAPEPVDATIDRILERK